MYDPTHQEMIDWKPPDPRLGDLALAVMLHFCFGLLMYRRASSVPNEIRKAEVRY